jgi:hypothetical protein
MSDENNAYTPDELDFLDRAMIALMVETSLQPSNPPYFAERAKQNALALLAERRKIRGPAKVLDEEGAKRLERLDAFYAGAYRLAGFRASDAQAEFAPTVLGQLEAQKNTLHERTSALSSATFANAELKRQIAELQKQPRTTLLQQAYLTMHERVCKALDEAKLPLCEGKDSAECVQAMITRIAELEREQSEVAELVSLSGLVAPGRTMRAAVASIIKQIETQAENLRLRREHIPQVAKERDDALARVAEIEKQYAAESTRSTQYRDFEMELRDVLQVPHAGLDLQVELQGLLLVAKQRAEEHEKDVAKINELETKLADQAPKVKEWLDAIDALAEAWPRDVPCKDNPTHAEWIRDLVAMKDKRAQGQIADVLGNVRERIEAIPGRDEISDNLNGAKWVYREDAIKIIDELAELGQSNTSRPK